MDRKKDQVSEAGQALSELGASRGGKARAAKLTSEERRSIARLAAEKRWGISSHQGPRETHGGVLRIGDREIPCANLSNGDRVLSTRGVNRAMGTKTTGTPRGGKEGARHLPYFLASKGLKPFISDELRMRVMNPIRYKQLQGGMAYGQDAKVIPQICKVILDASKAGVLKKTQQYLVDTAQVLYDGFATVGIIALIDEATGYQADRARDELNIILEAYISRELLPWTKRFPDEFFSQIYRLRNWKYQLGNHKRPGVVGTLINKLIYEPLPPGVLGELRKLNPPTEKGYRRFRHHQFLTPETGHPHLDKQITEVITLMRVSDDRPAFEKLFKKAFPKRGQQLELQYVEEERPT